MNQKQARMRLRNPFESKSNMKSGFYFDKMRTDDNSPPMHNLFRRTLLLWPWVIAALTAPCFGAQSLPDGWWLQDSPEKVLAKAQSINQQLDFFHAEKSGSTASSITDPFTGTNDNERTDIFQRKSSDGFVETIKVHVNGNHQFTDYKLKSGHYFFTCGQIIKAEFADGDDREKPIAATFDHPYDFKILKSEMAGTNDCIVIARRMTPKFLDAAKANYYKDSTKEQEAAFGGDFRRFIRSETDYYFRKTDGITLGLTRQNHLGEQLENLVYDKVEINQPMPDKEFILPKGGVKIARSFDEFQKILSQSGSFSKSRVFLRQARVSTSMAQPQTGGARLHAPFVAKRIALKLGFDRSADSAYIIGQVFGSQTQTRKRIKLCPFKLVQKRRTSRSNPKTTPAWWMSS
jgi:hypothetical protein